MTGLPSRNDTVDDPRPGRSRPPLHRALLHRPAVHDPGHRSIRKAGRAAVVMSAVFLFGIHVADNAQFAVVAAFTGAALLGIADFSGDRVQRMGVTAITAAVGIVLLVVGTAVSQSTLAATVTMVAVTFVVGFSAVFSGYFAAASSAVIVFYVVATGVEGPVSVIPARVSGAAVGGALSVAAIGFLWPSRSAAACRTGLATIYRELAGQVALVMGVSSPGEDRPAPATPGVRLEEVILAAERTIAASAWRPDGLAGPHKARMYLLQGAQRLMSLIEVLRVMPVSPDPELAATTDEFLAVVAGELGRCAEALAGGGRSLPHPSRIDEARLRLIVSSQRRFARLATTGAPRNQLTEFAARSFALQQLGWGSVLAAVQCRAMHKEPLDAPGALADSPLVSVLTEGPSVGKWVRRARRNLSLRSVHLQNSVRLALGLGVARLAVGLFDLKHGFWVGFATLVVLKTSAAGTRSTALQAALGTAIGFGVSTAFITTFGVNDAVYSVLLPLLVFGAFFLPGAVSFVAGQACFTMVIVVLFNLLKPSGWTLGLVRLEDVVIGAAIGLVIGLAMWPRGASRELARVVGALVSVGDTYARTTVARVTADDPAAAAAVSVRLDGLRRPVAQAAVDAEDVFSQYLSEPHQSDAPLMAWSALMSVGHQLWYGADVVQMAAPATGSAATMPELSAALDGAAAALARTHAGLVDALGRGTSVTIEPLDLADGPIDRSAPRAALTLLEVEAWMSELVADVAKVLPAVRVLAPVGEEVGGSDQPAGPRSGAARPGRP